MKANDFYLRVFRFHNFISKTAIFRIFYHLLCQYYTSVMINYWCVIYLILSFHFDSLMYHLLFWFISNYFTFHFLPLNYSIPLISPSFHQLLLHLTTFPDFYLSCLINAIQKNNFLQYVKCVNTLANILCL